MLQLELVDSVPAQALSQLQQWCTRYNFMFILYLIVWGVEPVVTHQTSWLESTGVCGVHQNQASGSSVEAPHIPLLLV